MKFIHIADVHLGMQPDIRTPWSKKRQIEIYESFQRVLKQCEDSKVDLLLIAGDLFHRQPLLKELKEINYLFQKLSRTKVIIMAGNHDYISHTSNYHNFRWAPTVFMFQEDTLSSVYIEECNTRVFGLSYLTRDIREAKYHEQVVMNKNENSVLLAHGGDERDIPINRQTVLGLGYDYVAMGHIHKPSIFSNKMAYSGSLEPLDKTETGQHGYILGEITSDALQKQTKVQFIPFSCREYKTLTIEVKPEMTLYEWKDRILMAIKNEGEKHIYTIHLEGCRDTDLEYQEEDIKMLGNIVEIKDETIPNYDFTKLGQENADNIIGMFIHSIGQSDCDQEVKDKALYLGVKALMKQKTT